MELFKQKTIEFCTKYKIFELSKTSKVKRHEYTEEEILFLSDWNEIQIYLTHLSSDLFPIFRSKYGRIRHKGDDELNSIVNPINEELYSLICDVENIMTKQF